MLYLHHDDLAIESDHVHLMRAYHLWVETVRNTVRLPYPGYGPDWEPSDIDIVKSRLFWRIRSGYAPLPWAPPCAYSCPWYEVVEDLGSHAAFEARRVLDDKHLGDVWFIAQTPYKHVETLEDNRHVVAFGEYRFEVHRDPAAEAARVGGLNPHNPDCETEYYARIVDDPTRAWFIRRVPGRESLPAVAPLRGWAASLKPSMTTKETDQ